MKKIISLILFGAIFVGFSAAYSIGDISVSFCNSSIGQNKSLNFVAKAGSPYEFCVEFTNNSKEDIPISIGFVDGQFTNGESRNKACSNQGNLFAPYVDFKDNDLVIPSLSKVTKIGYLSFPIGYSREINGCLVYNVPQKKKITDGGATFDVIVRKASFMDGYVVGEFKRDIGFDSGNVSYYIDDQNNLVLSFPFKNNGMLPEFLQFTGLISNSLGYSRSISASEIILGPSNLSVSFSDIPFYKGNYSFYFEAISWLDPNLDLSYLSDKDKQPVGFVYKKNIFIVPWKLVFEVIGFIFALFVIRKILKLLVSKK